ncbi:LysR family transcriptional regulator [Nioella sp.]|uniref:LysR family transcriptional regulator n=1 Tax=Nioella sp. TaxID=1912091 RepID=UPI0035123865
MQIELIETFLDLCETRSFNQTAERLDITQSTVSGRVKALEKTLGRRLFLRSRSGTSLTLEGMRFEPHARALRVNWSEALRATRDAGPTATTLRVGIQRDLTGTNIGDWVRSVRQFLPETSLYVESDFSTQMCNDLVQGNLDIAVIYSPKPHPDLHFETLSEVRFRMISDVADQLRMIPRDSYIMANISPAFARLHDSVHPSLAGAAVSCGQDSLLEALLTSLGGTAYVLEETGEKLVASGRFASVKKAPVLPQPVYSAIHLRNRHRSSHRRLIQLLAAHFADPA